MFENIRLSFRGIWAHKMRSFLTMLGIIIGIAAIIAIVSTIKGTNEQIKQNLVGAGENTVEISLYQGEWEYEMEYNGIPEGVPLVADEVVEQLKEIPHVENVSRGFLPLAGTGLRQAEEEGEAEQGKARAQGAAVETGETGAQGAAEQAASCYDVILTGNYTKLSFFEPYINWINEEYAAFYRGIIDDLLEHPACTVEEVALAHCEREMGKEPNDQLRIALHKMIFIDLYVRNYWRGKAVRTLVNAGIPVHVVGKGWEELEDVRHPECLKLHSQTDSVTCLGMLADAKVSLNVMPWFKDGAHDRVFNSILNGAVCVTDPSRYLEEELHEGEGVCYVALQDMDALPEKVKDLLQNDSGRNEIVRRGRAIVEQKHTWAQRAKTLAAWIAEDAAQ